MYRINAQWAVYQHDHNAHVDDYNAVHEYSAWADDGPTMDDMRNLPE